MAESCRLDHPALADRFDRFADEFRSPAEREKRRLAQRDRLVRDMARKFYPLSLGAKGRARIIASHIAEMNPEAECLPPARPQNADLREVVAANSDKIAGLGFETIRRILRG